jgi:arylsulfatase A-like enzyme
VGVLLKTLSDQGFADNTIVVMISDHANHFLTRTQAEWKCTPHDGSIHIPLLIQGPGFDYAWMNPDVVSIVDVAPSLLDAADLKIPDSMQGRSFFPTLNSKEIRHRWRQEAFIQFSDSAIGRALRTPEWTYCAIDPDRDGMAAPTSTTYQDYQMYNLAADPHQLLNLSGRYETRAIADQLRERLIKRMVEAGEAKPTITPRPYGLYS